jgi:hypothetical protein
MHAIETNSCSEARLNITFYFGCGSWRKHDLDLSARGIFKLLPPSEASKVMVNIFGTYNEEESALKDLKSTMDTFQKKVNKCTSRLPNRQNMEFFEEFSSGNLD